MAKDFKFFAKSSQKRDWSYLEETSQSDKF